MSNVVIALFGAYGFDRAAQGVAGAGRRLADRLESDLRAVVVGEADEALSSALSQIADRVVIANQEELRTYQPESSLSAFEQLSRDADAKAVLLSNDTYSQEVAPRLAARLGGSSMADAADVDVQDGKLLASRSAYGGKAISVYELKRSPAVVWIRARAFAVVDGGGRNTEAENVVLDLPSDDSLRIVRREQAEQEGVKLEDATLIVSGGRGLGGPEPFEQLRRLAATIGAEMAASRAACDAGWVPPGWQVGQTGKKVAPDLYLAIALSGASQHLLGMGDSKVVAAINTDPDAPIFKHCSFGIVEDYKNVVPPLTDKMATLKK